MTQLLEWDFGSDADRRAAQAKAMMDAGEKTFREVVERMASSMEEENMSDADKNLMTATGLVMERLSGRGADAVPFLLGFQIGGMTAKAGNLMQVMNLVDVAELGYEAACEAEGDTLAEAFGDAIVKHVKAMMEARS